METIPASLYEKVYAAFTEAPFVADMGITLLRIAYGCCEAQVKVGPRLLQHLGLVHGGVIMTLAGHAALGAALSVQKEESLLVAPDVSLSMFRPVKGGLILARAVVIKSGATLNFVETEVFTLPESGSLSAKQQKQQKERLVAKGRFTLMNTCKP